MKSVCICGLYARDFRAYKHESQLKRLGLVWTLNDWYQSIPCLKSPAKIWNIHTVHRHPSSRRFQGNWKQKYKEAALNGAQIIVRKEIPGVPNQQFFDEEDFKRHFGAKYAQSSISIMICQAALDGLEEINIIGVAFDEPEYEKQISSVLTAVNYARARGITVNVFPTSRETDWGIRMMKAEQPQNTKFYWED